MKCIKVMKKKCEMCLHKSILVSFYFPKAYLYARYGSLINRSEKFSCIYTIEYIPTSSSPYQTWNSPHDYLVCRGFNNRHTPNWPIYTYTPGRVCVYMYVYIIYPSFVYICFNPFIQQIYMRIEVKLLLRCEYNVFKSVRMVYLINTLFKHVMSTLNFNKC